MCGRYYSLFDKQHVAEHFHVRRAADNVGIVGLRYEDAEVAIVCTFDCFRALA
jgi:hypothetical protein